MDTATENTDLVELSMGDKVLLNAALKALADRLRNLSTRDPLMRDIHALRTKVGWGVEPNVPAHVIVNEVDYLSLMSVISSSMDWRIAIEQDENVIAAQRFNVIVEVTREEDEWRFELARNLQGTGRFMELRPEDLRYFTELEQKISEAAGSSAQIVHEIIEIPVPWDFMPDSHGFERAGAYIESVSNGAIIPSVHATLTDVHSDMDLAEAEFGGIMAEVSAFRGELPELRAFVEEHTAAIKAARLQARQR